MICQAVWEKMKINMLIRRATPADLPACAKIVNDYVDQTDWLPRMMSHSDIGAMFSADMLKTRYFLVAEEGGVIGGYLSMNEELGIVPGLYISPDLRGQGVGKALMDAAKQRRPGGLKLTVFEPNIRAKDFYEREGFVEVSEERSDDTAEGVPTLMMRWEGAEW